MQGQGRRRPEGLPQVTTGRTARQEVALRKDVFVAGLRASLPLLPGTIPFGVICGVAMVASGIPPLAAMAMSLLVFAGASMVASAQLLASGTPALMIIVATLFINLRFMMYSASLRQHFAHLSLRWRLLIGCLLADNAYGLMLSRYAEHPDDEAKLEYYLGASIPVWVGWQVAVLAGIVIGAGIPTHWRLEFAAPLAFIALTAPFLRDRAMIAAAVASAVVVVAAHDLPLRLSIMAAAVIGITVGLLVERKPA